MKPVRRRPAAMADMLREVNYRQEKAGFTSAEALISEMRACLHSIAQAPGHGSHRIGQMLGVAGLQWKRVGKTRLWFWYVEEALHVDVIRLISTDQLPSRALLPEDLL